MSSSPIQGLTDWLRSGLKSDGSEPECKHVDHMGDVGGIPDDDSYIWYSTKETKPDEAYWCETDVAYIRLKPTAIHYICLGCGEEKTIKSSEKIGGRDGIKLKENMSDEELSEFRENVSCGSFYNGVSNGYREKWM